MFRFTKEDKQCLMKIGIGFIVIMILIKLFRNTKSSKIVEGLDNKALASVARNECVKQLKDDDLSESCKKILVAAFDGSEKEEEKGGQEIVILNHPQIKHHVNLPMASN